MKIRFPSLLIAASLFLAACGGGSSSGGDSEIITINDGVYEGTQTFIITAPDGDKIDGGTNLFNMTVFQNSLTIFDPSFSAEAEIINGAFSASSGQFIDTDGEITCAITFIYDGVIDNGLVQGTISGDFDCSLIDDGATQVTFSINGSFEGVRGVVSSKVSMVIGIEFDLNNLIDAVSRFQ